MLSGVSSFVYGVLLTLDGGSTTLIGESTTLVGVGSTLAGTSSSLLGVYIVLSISPSGSSVTTGGTSISSFIYLTF